MKTGIVHSSHGDMTIDMDTGTVTSHGQNKEYTDIVRFDLDEYFKHYPTENRAVVNSFDVLDLGGWLDTGEYEEPNHDWRKDCAAENAAVKAGQLNVAR